MHVAVVSPQQKTIIVKNHPNAEGNGPQYVSGHAWFVTCLILGSHFSVNHCNMAPLFHCCMSVMGHRLKPSHVANRHSGRGSCNEEQQTQKSTQVNAKPTHEHRPTAMQVCQWQHALQRRCPANSHALQLVDCSGGCHP